jgi:hypothetical protein
MQKTMSDQENTPTLEELKAQASEGIKQEVEDPTEMASTMLALYTPKFNEGVDQLSSNALRRVLKRLVSYPLNDKEYKATSNGEKNVFLVGDRLLEAKFLLIMENYHKIIQDQAKKETT